jgi:hypothetical protein
VCNITPLNAGTVCNDGDTCTSNDQCDGHGNCGGTPYQTQTGFQGSSPTGNFPEGNSATGICIYATYYCNQTGPASQPAPAGYSNQYDPGTSCDYNGVQGGNVAPYYQENFCASCNGDCSTCPMP